MGTVGPTFQLGPKCECEATSEQRDRDGVRVLAADLMRTKKCTCRCHASDKAAAGDTNIRALHACAARRQAFQGIDNELILV